MLGIKKIIRAPFNFIQVDNSEPGYVLVQFNGKNIAIVGSAPDRVDGLNLIENFTRFIKSPTYSVGAIVVLDSRRVGFWQRGDALKSTSTHSPMLTAENLLQTYHRFGLEVYFQYDKTSFHLGDRLEIFSALADYPRINRQSLMKLFNNDAIKTLANASAAIGIFPETHSDFFQELTVCHINEHATYLEHKKFIDDLEFHPSIKQLDAFVHCIEDLNKSAKIPLIHCAGGKGRTGLFLTYLIMKLRRCDYRTALKLVEDGYLDDDISEVKSYELSFFQI